MTQEYCNCELRNRQWDPLSGRCLTCHLYFHDARFAGIETGADVAALRALPDAAFLNAVNDAIASNHTSPPKTWSIVVERAGAHWQATVRRGVEGSRALIGKLTFDLSDADDVEAGLNEVASRLTTHAVVCTIAELQKRALVKTFADTPGMFSTLLGFIGDDVRAEVVPHMVTMMVERFGARINLASVGPSHRMHPMRDLVFADDVPMKMTNVSEHVKRWLVTLSCGHKKYTETKASRYTCLECPEE